MNKDSVVEQVLNLERPHRSLWTYYIIRSILTGPAFPFVLVYLYFRYYTLRYRFDAEGVHMRVGILFRREVNLTYTRIQDIHLKSGIVQRWLGLADLEIQTASGSATAELVIEGFKEYEMIRDYLYTRMRGYQGRTAPSAPAAAGSSVGLENNEALALLIEIRDELRGAREALQKKHGGSTGVSNV